MSSAYQDPVLTHVFSGDQFLLVEWLNYIPQIVYTNDAFNSDAYITVVDQSTGAMRYVYLTETELFAESYKITGLTNNKTYSIQLTQTLQGASTDPDVDATQYNSNTKYGTPKQKPSKPVIVITQPDHTPVVTNTSNDFFSITLDVNYNAVQGEQSLDKIIFKFVDNLNYNIQSYKQNISTTPYTHHSCMFTFSQTVYRHTITDIPVGNYFISCLTINENGSSELSDTVTISIGEKPVACDVTEVESGVSGEIKVDAELLDNYNVSYQTDGIDLEYKTTSAPDSSYVAINIPRSQLTLTNGTLYLTDYRIMNLVNAQTYIVRARGYYFDGQQQKVYGPYGDEGRGTPAQICDIDDIFIEATVSGESVSYEITSNVSTYTKVYSYVLKQNGNDLLVGLLENIANDNTQLLGSFNQLSLVAGDIVQLFVTPYHVISDTANWTYPSLTNGNQWYGNQVSSDPLTVLDVPPPASNLRATSFSDSNPNSYEITVEWTPPTTISENAQTGYILKLYTVTNRVETLFLGPCTESNASAQSYTFSFYQPLTEGQELYATIVAFNDLGNSDIVSSPSFHWHFTYENYADGLACNQTSETNMRTSWLVADNQVGYTFTSYELVYYITESSFSSVNNSSPSSSLTNNASSPIMISDQSVAEYNLNNIIQAYASKYFTFKITTKVVDQYGATISNVVVLSQSSQIRDVPNDITVFNVTDFTNQSLSFAWSAPINEPWNAPTSYDIELSTSSTFDTIHVSQNTTQLYWTFNNLVLGQNYYARVRANNAIGSSNYNTIGPFHPAPNPPSSVQGLGIDISRSRDASGIEVVVLNGIWIDWTQSVNANLYTFNNYTYRIYKNNSSESDSSYNLIATNTTTSNQFGYVLDHVDVGDQYFYDVRVNVTANGLAKSSTPSTSVPTLYATRPVFNSIVLDHMGGTTQTKVTITINNNYSQLTDLFTFIDPDNEYGSSNDSTYQWNLLTDRISTVGTVSTYQHIFAFDTFKVDGQTVMLAVTSNAIGITVKHTFNSSVQISGEPDDNGEVVGVFSDTNLQMSTQ